MSKIRYKTEDLTFLRRTLLVVSILALIGTSALTVSAVLAGLVPSALGLAMGVLMSLVTLILVWAGRLELPRYILPPVTLIIVSYLIIVGEGIRDEGVLGYAIVIAFAGFLLGKRWSSVYTALSIMIVSFIGLGQMGDWLPITTHAKVPLMRVVVTDILLLFLGGLIYIIIQSLEHVLAQVHVREVALAESNETLRRIQTELEKRIAERVQHFDRARRDAEAARNEVEQQAWQITGLAKLSEVMRGDLSVTELSHSVIQMLCLYLGAEVGAIFLVRAAQLYLSGSYAYSPDHPQQFEFGEGLVGQAAQDQSPIVSKLPADSIQITSALGEIIPTQVIAVPFYYEEETIGVFVLGSIAEFAETTREFLKKAAESIGIVFHTIQVREKIDQLLLQSQQQAEELQAREEELRSMNEELETQAENMRMINLELQRVQSTHLTPKSEEAPG